MELLIKNAKIIDHALSFKGDIYVKDGIIKEIGETLDKACDILDAKGQILMPAFVDLHCHFRDPGLTYKEDLETGSRAAVKGGFTTVNLMPNTKPIVSSMETVNYVLEKAAKIGLIDVHQTMSITKDLQGKDISHLNNINSMVKAVTDDGRGVNDNKVMYDAMTFAKDKGLIVMSHAEDEATTPISQRLSENLMTYRDTALAKYTGARLHMCHVSTIEAMKDIIRAKEEGYSVTCEVTPHHIALTDEVKYRVNPPIRRKEDVMFLIDAIKKGYVDAIGTDHAPHSKEDKEKGACGMSGIETAFSICYSNLVKAGEISINKLSEIMSKNPAEIIGFNKGKIAIGYDADFVLVDLEGKEKIDVNNFESKGKNSPFDGMEFYGMVMKTIKAGKIVYERK